MVLVGMFLTGLARAASPGDVIGEVARSQHWRVSIDDVGCEFVTRALLKTMHLKASAVFLSDTAPARAELNLEAYRTRNLMTVKPVGYWKTNSLGRERQFFDSRTPRYFYSYTLTPLFKPGASSSDTLICALVFSNSR